MTEEAEYIDKLVHPILEIRARALSSLLQKVELNLVPLSRLNQHPNLIPNLLQLLDLGPHTLRPQALNLLFFLFKNESSKRQFVSLGGVYYLHNLKATAPLGLLPDINHLLHSVIQTSEG